MEAKPKIRLIGVDLDGTLLTDEKELCSGLEETLKKARENGVYIVPVTGRPFQGIPECVRGLDVIDYVICSNGASIIDAKSKKRLYCFSMSNEKSREVFSVLKAARCIFEPFADGVCYTEQEILDSYIGYFKGSPVEEYLRSTRVICKSIEALFTEEGKQADEFFVMSENKAEREKITAALDKIGGVQYWFYDDRYIEITKEDCDKGAALKTLCRHLGVSESETMAFGDGDNDLSFLAAAGVSVAMGNAPERIKEKADIIADTNNNNGVGKMIEKILDN